MPSANDFAKRALTLLGVVAPTDDVSAEDGDLALEILNNWIDSLGTERQALYYVARTTKTLTANTATYTIGSGGAINIVRPVWIDNAGLIINTADTYPVEIPIRVMTDDEWAQRAQKTLPSNLLLGIYYDHNWSAGLGLIYVWPIPNVGTTQLVLYTPTALSEFADLSTNYTFPPGMRRTITYNLANELAPFYPMQQPDPRIGQIAAQSLMYVKRANLRLSSVYVDRAIQGAHRGMATVTPSQFMSGNF
jgi:hypothetical protein